MFYVIFAPKSIETQFIKRVQGHQDYGLVRQVLTRCRSLRLQSRQLVRVLLCEDGKRGGPSSAESVRQGIERLYDGWETPATVEIVAFSFLSQPACMTELLMDADLFYFAGFF